MIYHGSTGKNSLHSPFDLYGIATVLVTVLVSVLATVLVAVLANSACNGS